MQEGSTRIFVALLALQPAAARELADNATHISGVEREIPHEIGRQRLLTMSQFVENTCFGEGAVAIEQSMLQHADLGRVEAIELADSADVMLSGVGRHSAYLQTEFLENS